MVSRRCVSLAAVVACKKTAADVVFCVIVCETTFFFEVAIGVDR